MGCGCGGNNNATAQSPIRNLVGNSSGILSEVANSNVSQPTLTSEEQEVINQQRKVEKLKRDALLRALSRP